MKKLLLMFLMSSHLFGTEYLILRKKMFPLPDEYRQYKTSDQGLRDPISDVNIGGGSSLDTYHNAHDYACPDKTEVYACDDGYVINCYPSYYNGEKWKGHNSYGGCIEIIHSDGTRSFYAHLSETIVNEGDSVNKGQIIGYSGGVKGRRGSGNSTGPHLHFSIYISIEDILENNYEDYITRNAENDDD